MARTTTPYNSDRIDRGVTSSSGVEQPVSVSITQSAASLTGEFTSTEMSGAFAARTNISGTLTLRGSDGCAATAKMSGLVDGSELRLNLPWIGDPCPWSGNLRMTLRQP